MDRVDQRYLHRANRYNRQQQNSPLWCNLGALITSRTLDGARPRTVVVNPDNGYVATVGSGNLLEFADFDHSAVYTTRLTGLGTYSTFNPTQEWRSTPIVPTLCHHLECCENLQHKRLVTGAITHSSIQQQITGPGALALDSHGNILSSTIVPLSSLGRKRPRCEIRRNKPGWSNYLSSYVDTLNANTSDTPSGVFVDNADNLYVLVRGTRAGGDGAIYKSNASGPSFLHQNNQ